MDFIFLHIMRLPFNSVWYSIKRLFDYHIRVTVVCFGLGRFSDTERNNDRRCNGYIGLDILRYGYTYIGILFCYQCIIVVGCHQGVGSSILHTNYFQRNRMFLHSCLFFLCS